MNNISNIHKSFPFTIIVIVFSFLGIIMSQLYSNSENKKLFQEYFKNSSEKPKKIYSELVYDYRGIEIDIANLEYSNSPMDSVPVKVVLGKIKKIENLYLPKLHLAFLGEEKMLLLNTSQYFNRLND
tara:strand:- start:4 stop:384 length:381 start_codon:yes stop_codon:yes gene_type:complete